MPETTEELVPIGIIRKVYTTVHVPKEIADRLDAELKEISEAEIYFLEAEEWLDKNRAWPDPDSWETYEVAFYCI